MKLVTILRLIVLACILGLAASYIYEGNLNAEQKYGAVDHNTTTSAQRYIADLY